MLVNLILFVLGLAGMEGVAWLTHRYVMHGPLWILHRSHHQPGRRRAELNDLFAIVFAGLAILLFAVAAAGVQPLWWVALGMTAYGLLYALAHDGLAHGRFPLGVKPRRGYLLRLVQAHNLHHLTHEREGAVSFGFLIAPRPEALMARLQAQRERNAAARAATTARDAPARR